MMPWRALALGLLVLLSVPALAQEGTASPQVSTPAPVGDEWTDDFSDEDFEDTEDDIEGVVEDEIIPDPLESLNRVVFAFNDRLYFYLLKPVARGWRILPRSLRRSLSRFYDNLRAPMRMVNCGLQLRFRDAGTEALRFGVNSTVGLLGLFDPARKWWGLRRQDEDFGQTLGHYGVGQGFYLVLPFMGPSSLRDGLARLVDTRFLDPVYLLVKEDSLRLGLWGLDLINYLSLDKDTYESIKRDSLDPYRFMKNAYAQTRAAKVRQ